MKRRTRNNAMFFAGVIAVSLALWALLLAAIYEGIKVLR